MFDVSRCLKKECLRKCVVVVKKAKKAPPVAKSLVILEVKPWGPETNLDELGKKIINEVV